MSGPRPSVRGVYVERCEALVPVLVGDLVIVDGEIAALRADIEAHGRFTVHGDLRPSVDMLARCLGRRTELVGRLSRLRREIAVVRTLDAGGSWPRLVESDDE